MKCDTDNQMKVKTLSVFVLLSFCNDDLPITFRGIKTPVG